MAWNEPGNSGRDPWNQGRRGDNAPDLDQLLERLKTRFKGRGPRPNGLSPGGTGFLAAAIVLIWSLTCFYVVDEQERAVVLRFGEHVRTNAPGWGWRAWPVETVEKVNVTKVRQVAERSDMLTKDENIVDVELKVQYRVSSAEKFLFRMQDPEATLRLVTKSAVREVIGLHDLDFILTEGRQTVASKAQELLQGRLDAYDSGLEVAEVNLQEVRAPEPVKDAFDDALKAREDRERLKNEAEAYANDRVPKARGAAARQVAEAIGYREQRVAEAEGEAARFTKLLAEYRKAPRVTRDRLYLEMMSDVLSRATKVIVDLDRNGPMIYLPLDKLQPDPRSAPGDAEGAAAPPPRNAAPAERSRDRGGR